MRILKKMTFKTNQSYLPLLILSAMFMCSCINKSSYRLPEKKETELKRKAELVKFEEKRAEQELANWD